MLLFLSTQNTYLPRFLFFSEKKSNFALIINSILSEKKKPNKNKSNQTTHTHKQTKPKISTVELKWLTPFTDLTPQCTTTVLISGFSLSTHARANTFFWSHFCHTSKRRDIHSLQIKIGVNENISALDIIRRISSKLSEHLNEILGPYWNFQTWERESRQVCFSF